MNLYEKMFAVMDESEAIEKTMTVGSGSNSYKVVSEAAMLNMVKPLFKKYKLIIFPTSGEIQDHTLVWEKAGYGDNAKAIQTLRAMTELKVTYRIADVESGEFQEVVGFGNGSDSQDKGAGKASTYSLKNALSKTFMLFSGEDTDNEHSNDIGKDKNKTSKADEKAKQEMETLKLKPISEQKCGIITKMIKDAKVDTVQFLEYYKINSLAEITNEMLPGIIKKLQTTIDTPKGATK